MGLSKYINIPILVISFAVGIFFVYITTNVNRTILVYPTHENYSLLQYRDKTGNCFALKETAVDCPNDSNSIAKIPAQS